MTFEPTPEVLEAVARAIACAIDEERFYDAPGFQQAAAAAIAAYEDAQCRPLVTLDDVATEANKWLDRFK